MSFIKDLKYLIGLDGSKRGSRVYDDTNKPPIRNYLNPYYTPDGTQIDYNYQEYGQFRSPPSKHPGDTDLSPGTNNLFFSENDSFGQVNYNYGEVSPNYNQDIYFEEIYMGDDANGHSAIDYRRVDLDKIDEKAQKIFEEEDLNRREDFKNALQSLEGNFSDRIYDNTIKPDPIQPIIDVKEDGYIELDRINDIIDMQEITSDMKNIQTLEEETDKDHKEIVTPEKKQKTKKKKGKKEYLSTEKFRKIPSTTLDVDDIVEKEEKKPKKHKKKKVNREEKVLKDAEKLAKDLIKDNNYKKSTTKFEDLRTSLSNKPNKYHISISDYNIYRQYQQSIATHEPDKQGKIYPIVIPRQYGIVEFVGFIETVDTGVFEPIIADIKVVQDKSDIPFLYGLILEQIFMQFGRFKIDLQLAKDLRIVRVLRSVLKCPYRDGIFYFGYLSNAIIQRLKMDKCPELKPINQVNSANNR